MNDAAFERPLAWLISSVLVYKICYVPRELHGFGDVASNEKIGFLFLHEFLARIPYYEFHLYVELSRIRRWTGKLCHCERVFHRELAFVQSKIMVATAASF